MTNLRLRVMAIATLLLAVGCANHHTAREVGYLATSACAQRTSQSSCSGSATCQWIASANVCTAADPCLALDKQACGNASTCAWSNVTSLCPAGATCDDDGFCHGKGNDGSDCACVSPVAASSNGTVASVECDCTNGGTGGSGGACTCACPTCAPGETCPPCDCSCDDGGSGCTGTTTCACACGACPPGEDCPPCDCSCGTGVVSPSGGCSVHMDAASCVADTGNHCGVAPGPGGAFVCTASTIDACAAHGNEASCLADTANGCVYETPPCPEGVTGCATCAQATPAPGPACNCPDCAEGMTCNCACAGSTSGASGTATSTCVAPSPPQSEDAGVACPAVGCAPSCPNGTTTDSNGCPTCTCAP